MSPIFLYPTNQIQEVATISQDENKASHNLSIYFHHVTRSITDLDSPPKGKITISFLGITIELTDVDLNSQEFRIILGVLIYLFVVTRVISAYKYNRRKRFAKSAMKDAEKSINQLIDDLCKIADVVSPAETEFIVFSDGKEITHNVFDERIRNIRESIIKFQDKYRDDIDSPLAEAVQELYNSTIANPANISKIKIAVQGVRNAGKTTKLLGKGTNHFLDSLAIQLSNLI